MKFFHREFFIDFVLNNFYRRSKTPPSGVGGGAKLFLTNKNLNRSSRKIVFRTNFIF
jgi:hypothetical protein